MNPYFLKTARENPTLDLWLWVFSVIAVNDIIVAGLMFNLMGGH